MGRKRNWVNFYSAQQYKYWSLLLKCQCFIAKYDSRALSSFTTKNIFTNNNNVYKHLFNNYIHCVWYCIKCVFSIDSSNLFNTKSTFIIFGLINIVLLLEFEGTLIEFHFSVDTYSNMGLWKKIIKIKNCRGIIKQRDAMVASRKCHISNENATLELNIVSTVTCLQRFTRTWCIYQIIIYGTSL